MMEPLLPALREDLELLEGPDGPGGTKTFLIRDGILNRFVRISADTARLLALWKPGLSISAFVKAMAEQGAEIAPMQIMVFLNFLAQNQLIQQSEEQALVSRKPKGWRGILNAGLHNYLFFKIPLIYPDHFIQKHLRKTDFLFTSWFVRITLAILIFDIIFMVPRIDHAFDLLAAQGTLLTAFKFAVAYIFSKIVHEFAHGIMAARQGCMVSSMGVGFMLAFPVFYADVTDTWRIRDDRGRLAVASAGLVAELTIAIYATALWILNPVPALNSFFLHLALAIWISSLLINGNPLMRFDGYHILSDFLQEKNLQMKSFAAVKTFARYHLGFTRRKPELKRVLLIYGFAAVIYRVLLISGIALVLYHLSFRLLGVALFAVEIWLFLAAPLFAEIKAMSALRRAAPDHRRLRRSGLIALVFLLAMFLPFSAQIGAPAIATHQHVVSIYTREGGISMVGLSKDAQPVPAHHVLLHLTHPDLVARLAQSETSTKILEVRRANMSVSDPDRTRIQAVEAEIDLEQERAQALRNQLDQLQLQSPEAGQFWPRDEVHPGQWIAARALVGQLVTGPQRAIAFVSERDLAAIERGGDAVFTDDFGRSSVRGRVTHIDLAASPSISFPELASVYGGPIEARSNGRNSLVSISSIYRVEIELEETPFTARTLGTARIYGKSRSLAERAGTWLIALFRREGHLN